MKKAFLSILLFLCLGSVFPQADDSLKTVKELRYDDSKDLIPVDLDDKKIANYRNLKEFEYIEVAKYDSWWTRFKRWIAAKYNDFINWLFGNYEPGNALSIFIKILPFLLLIILLGLIGWLFSRLNPGGIILSSPKESEVFLSKEEDLVRHEDLATLIAQAIRESNYRLAVRYYYLCELRKLDELRHIEYEYQKTNKEYSEEIKNYAIRKHFSEITKLYEFIWYGSFGVSESDFKLVEKGFLRMEELLNTADHE